MYKIDITKFKSVFPNCKNADELCNLMDNILPAEGIDTKERVNAFLAQCGHESGGFTIFAENLNYSAKGLRRVFGKYFPTDALAAEFERKPEKIANKVYANRMGNSTEASGEGFKYRGRGFIMTTGKDNYSKLGKKLGVDLITNPDLLTQDISLMLKAAIFFWNSNKLNTFCDANDFIGLTKRINGGINGLEERQKYYKLLMS